MNKTFKTNKQWFIQIEDKETHERMSICDDGLVYGTARGQRLGILRPQTINIIKDILNGKLDEDGNEFTNITYANRINYMYNFKKNVYTKYYDNNTILRIRDDSRIERPIKVVGWHTTITILKLIKKQSSWKKLF